MEMFRPVLPSPRHLRTSEVMADAFGRPLLDPQLLLMDCRLPEEAVRARYPSLWGYLNTDRGQQVCQRYLCEHRSPWYAQEDRPGSMFVCTYMGRSDLKSGRPFRFILNHSAATATNVYLLLYPRPMLSRALKATPDLAREVWRILKQISPESLLGEGRVYGGGLHKLEPRELANVPADEIAAALATRDGKQASQLELLREDAGSR